VLASRMAAQPPGSPNARRVSTPSGLRGESTLRTECFGAGLRPRGVASPTCEAPACPPHCSCVDDSTTLPMNERQSVSIRVTLTSARCQEIFAVLARGHEGGSMYVTIRSYGGGDEVTDALIAREQDIRNVIGTIDGFRAYYLVRTADGPTTISVFEDQAGAEASSAAAAAYIRENMADVSLGAPQITTGESVLSF
jgi:hypothetical protein